VVHGDSLDVGQFIENRSMHIPQKIGHRGVGQHGFRLANSRRQYMESALTSALYAGQPQRGLAYASLTLDDEPRRSRV
jgi:hypothetical protein